MIESEFASQLESDNDRAQAEMREFLRAEIERVIGTIERNDTIHVDDERIKNIRQLLENPTTVVINEPEFTVRRNFQNGFDLEWINQEIVH